MRAEPQPLSFWQDLRIYAGRMREFNPTDWLVYVLWIGLMLGLFLSVSGFLALGLSRGVVFPDYVWIIPIGIFLFVASIALDTIGHRTIYQQELRKGESLVHGITIFCGIGSVVALVAAYAKPGFFWIPAACLTGLSVLYSLIDEALHWLRYFQHKSDRVEMWSHFGILFGHSLMMTGWWVWFSQGYPGVAQTLGQGL
ncbi:MAG: hypothetical protein CVV27_19620 [Candidatus Melainabacteria bacterium HGW-Melainabacteria-1]|nr:MAG: hypothetical protein CVV27_19620 [Candidatus Melainabacteria bacterium HGW-Melainabacteria-1]